MIAAYLIILATLAVIAMRSCARALWIVAGSLATIVAMYRDAGFGGQTEDDKAA